MRVALFAVLFGVLLATWLAAGCTSARNGQPSTGTGGASGADADAAVERPAADTAGDGARADRAGDDTTTPSSVTVSIDNPSPMLELRASTETQVQVASAGYAGTVDLSVADLPAGITGTLAPSTLTLDGTNPSNAQLTLTTLSTAPSGTFPFRVVGSAGAGAVVHEASASLVVQFAITFTIPSGAASRQGPDRTTFGDYPTIVNAPPSFPNPPLTVNFYNADSTTFRIEGHDPPGFPITPPPGISPMTFDSVVRKPDMKAHEYNFELHEAVPCCAGRLLIQ